MRQEARERILELRRPVTVPREIGSFSRMNDDGTDIIVSQQHAAVDVSHRVQPLLGPVEPALLELRGKVPPPGTVEIAVPGRGAR